MQIMQSQHAQELTARFLQINQEIVAFVEDCPDAVWQATPPGEARTVGVVIHHIAAAHEPIAGLMMLVATGQPLPLLTVEMLSETNATHATHHARCTQGEAVINQVRTLSDEQLERTAQGALFGLLMTTQQLVETILIGHASAHFAGIRSVVMVR